MNTLEDIRRMTRSEVEVLRNQINRTVPTSLPYVVFAALANVRPEAPVISDRVFPIIIKAMYEAHASGSAYYVESLTSWFEHDEIKGCCYFSHNAHTLVYFLTASQTHMLEFLNSQSSFSEFVTKLNEAIGNLPDADAPTEEELRDPLVNELYMRLNSEAANVDERTSRFNGATWFEEIQKKVIVLAGLGGIGSYVCFLLARVQPATLFLYDDDVVEAANMSGQLYSIGDVGDFKANAISNMVKNYANYNNTFAITEKYKEDSDVADIMICGFDNMEARKIFFAKWQGHVLAKSDHEERKKCLFIDGRLSAEYLQVYCITGDDDYVMNEYDSKALFNDSEADETVCSYKQTTYMANMIGSIIVNIFTNFVANEVAGAPIRELPYLTTYDGNSMELKIV